MVDETTRPLETPAAPVRGGSLLSTPGGKIVAAGAAVGILMVIGAVVGGVLLFSLGTPAATTPPVTPVQPAAPAVSTSTPGGDAGAAKETTAVPPAVPNSELFTFRDIFKPIVEESEAATLPAGDDDSPDSTTAQEDTLYLDDIRTEDGEEKAVLTYNGEEYVLSEDEAVGDTPWKVLSIDSENDSVVMLYGDNQITLSVGQGTTSSAAASK